MKEGKSMVISIIKKITQLIFKNTIYAPLYKKVIANIVCALFVASITLPANAQQYKLGDIEILNPWARETPKGAKVSSGYFYIINHSNTPDRLVSISTDGVKTTEIHTMTVVNDIMKMEKMHNGIEIPGNGEVTLKPGGNHIMFMGFSKPFKLGDKVSAKLTFENAGTIDVDFSINAMKTTPPSKSTPAH